MSKEELIIPKDKLVFVPLGGATGIGMNFFAYGYKGKWLLVDCGIGFPGDGLPGVDVLLPNPEFLADKKNDIMGLVITHAHEDHIGAISYLWRDLACPIYATPFAHELIESKLNEAGFLGRAETYVVPPGDSIDLDPFEVEFIPMNHSIPEANALAIRTKEGLIVARDAIVIKTALVYPDGATTAQKKALIKGLEARGIVARVTA